MTQWPSGEQFELREGEQRAWVVEVGGGVRAYSVAGRDVLDPYPLDAICDGGHGAVLVPWPNRLGGGRYEFDGAEHRLGLSEPARGNAIHGLLRWRPWQALERTAASVTMGVRLHPQPGYPFTLDVRVAYRLDARDGLMVACTATNIGSEACPYGFGQHPYLSPGAGRLDDCALQLAASRHIVLDGDSLLPVGERDVRGTEFDFNVPRRLGSAQIDVALTGLVRDARGHAHATLTAPDGARIEFTAGERIHVLQVFTGDTLAPHRRRHGLAVEPMTCPPDAFRSGRDLIRLAPGESVTSGWSVRLVP